MNPEDFLAGAMTRRSALGATAALLGLASGQASAQMMESLRIVAGFPPGGTVDTVSRRLSERLRGRVAASALVDTRTGAGGQIAAQLVKAADRKSVV